MSILDLHADEMETAALNTRRDPYVAPRRSAWGGILTVAPRGAFRAAAEVGASLSDLGKAAIAYRDADSKQLERGGLPASAFSSDLGDSVRSYWDSLKPDPLTATKTEQVLYGFARVAAKIIPATIAAGPVGALAAGVEEGMTVSDELRQQGVPDGTRQLAGIVQGTGLASAALPLVGRTLGETAALYLAGGPGGFVAQQALTRKILENAGQDQVAGQYDPFDPVGLTVAAALPGFFTYRALKGQAAARAADAKATAAKAEADFMAAPVPSAKTATAQAAEAYTRESVDAAMVQNLRDTESRAAAEVPARMAEAYRGPVTENPNFKAWFGDSKVVDEQGAPLVAFKGGPTEDWRDGEPITEFRSKNGPWSGFFTDQAIVASRFAEAQLPMTVRGGSPAGVFPVFLKIERPLEVDAAGRPARDFQIDASVIGKTDSQLRSELLSGQYDGLILRNTADEGTVFVPLHPEQIKSAIGNSGRFDPNSASLTDPILPSDQGARLITDAAGTRLDLGRSETAPDAQNAYRAAIQARDGKAALDALGIIRQGEGRPVTDDDRLVVSMLTDGPAPDTPIRLDDSGNRVTFAADLAEVQRLAAEGTDDTLGTLDADLFRVAVECSLSGG